MRDHSRRRIWFIPQQQQQKKHTAWHTLPQCIHNTTQHIYDYDYHQHISNVSHTQDTHSITFSHMELSCVFVYFCLGLPYHHIAFWTISSPIFVVSGVFVCTNDHRICVRVCVHVCVNSGLCKLVCRTHIFKNCTNDIPWHINRVCTMYLLTTICTCMVGGFWDAILLTS